MDGSVSLKVVGCVTSAPACRQGGFTFRRNEKSEKEMRSCPNMCSRNDPNQAARCFQP